MALCRRDGGDRCNLCGRRPANWFFARCTRDLPAAGTIQGRSRYAVRGRRRKRDFGLMSPSASLAASVAERTLARVNRRLMPYLVLLYIVAYLDRVNVGFAGLQMTRELGFSNAVFGLGGGIFFLGYFLLEIPGAVLAEVWSARKWISRILLTWGFLASATGLIHTVQQFYWIRFSLGLAEAGFLPGLFVYVSHWYRPEDRGKAMAMLMAGAPASLVVGGPLSAIFLKIHW